MNNPPLYRASEAESLTLDELEHEAARINRETSAPLIYLEDRDVYVAIMGRPTWAMVLERRLFDFYWLRDVTARHERRQPS